MLSVVDQAFEIIKTSPGLGAAALARQLKIPPCNARRAAKALIAVGRVSLTGDQVSGFRYHAAHPQMAVEYPQVIKNHQGAKHVGNINLIVPTGPPTAPHAIDGVFREIPSPQTPTGRALVTARRPHDSRVAETLARNVAATQRGPQLRSPGFGSRIAEVLNSVFVDDPHGDEALSSLATAYRESAAATRATEVREARERVVATQQRQADVLAAEGARRAEQEQVERLVALRAVTVLWTRDLPVSESNNVPVGFRQRQSAAKLHEERPANRSVADLFGCRKTPAANPSWRQRLGTPKTPIWK